MAAYMKVFCAALFMVLSSVISGQERVSLERVFKRGHTNNWAVLVCTSRFWFNYRHVANVLSVYHSVKRLGIPDSHIILMTADDMACNPRNPKPGTVYNNVNQHINLYGDDVEVDYRGYDVTVENFIRILTGRLPDSVPRSKRLLSDERSNILVYMTGHGGDGFLKFQDAEEVTSVELADAFEQMWQKGRYHELFFMVDTCQAYSMATRLYSPNLLAVGSSLVGEDSLSHHDDPSIGVHVIDRFTYYVLQFLEKVNPDSKATVGDLFRYTSPSLVISTPRARTDLFTRNVDKTLITDFFGSVHDVEITNVTSTAELTTDDLEYKSDLGAKSADAQVENRDFADQFPSFPPKAADQPEGWAITQGFLVTLAAFALSVAVLSLL